MVYIVLPSIGHALTISGNNVGIGTNSPSWPLDVVGNINSSGNVTATGSLSGGSCSVTGAVTAGSATITGAFSAGTISGNGSGLTSLDPAKISSGTANINISGNAATATTASSVTAGAISFYGKVAIVAPSGGNYSDPALAMSDYSSWCGTPSATSPCLLKIMPGVYDVGSTSVQMQPYIDIEGSGENTTIIQGGIDSTTSGVVNAAGNAEIRFLTVQNTNIAINGIAISNPLSVYVGTAKITNVTAEGGSAVTNYGIYNVSPYLLTMTNVTVTVGGSGWSYGIYNGSDSITIMTNVTAIVSSNYTNYAVYNEACYYIGTTMNNVTAYATGGAAFNYGVYNSGCFLIMNNVTATVDGVGTNSSYGVYNDASSPTMKNVHVEATSNPGGTGPCYGVYNNNGSSPSMTHMYVIATTNPGGTGYGVYNNGSSPVMTNVYVTSYGGGSNYGVYNTSSNPVMTGITVNDSFIKNGGLPGTNYFGIVDDNSSSAIITDAIVYEKDGSSYNVGIYNENLSNSVLRNVAATASGGTYAFGIYNTNTGGPVEVNRSTLVGAGGSGDTRGIRNDSTYSIKVGVSEIVGTASGAVGTLSCIYCYDGSYAALNSGCQ